MSNQLKEATYRHNAEATWRRRTCERSRCPQAPAWEHTFSVLPTIPWGGESKTEACSRAVSREGRSCVPW
eukprot:858425-Pleurochrysis_carterae.AAC.1